MPVSASAPPAARRASACFACASAPASSTVMKAFSAPFSRPMRSRQARVSSTEETFLALRATDSSVSVALSKLLDDLRQEIEVVRHGRGDGLITLVLVGLGDAVLAQPLPWGETRLARVRHRLDAGRVDGAHLVDQSEDPVEALEHVAGLFRRDRDSGQPGN